MSPNLHPLFLICDFNYTPCSNPPSNHHCSYLGKLIMVAAESFIELYKHTNPGKTKLRSHKLSLKRLKGPLFTFCSLGWLENMASFANCANYSMEDHQETISQKWTESVWPKYFFNQCKDDILGGVCGGNVCNEEREVTR